MHEVELKEGLETKGQDGRGIDRLRLLAVRMRNLPDREQNKVSARIFYKWSDDGYSSGCREILTLSMGQTDRQAQ
jgi:hypothetical protein